ncbi:MAG: redoxin domain-containing protein, partial [Chloroflexota bacterium]
MRKDIITGATFPDYELPDQTGTRRRLSQIQGHDPMVVVLSRGHFCPKDRRQLRNLAELYPEIKVAYTKVVTISTDNLLETNEMRDGLGAAWPFLSDPKRIVQQDLEIAEYTDPTHDPMIPYTLVLGPELKVYSIYNGYWYWGRPSNEDLRRDLRELTRLTRPDWDLTAPGLREKWAANSRDDFWPYGR